MRILLGALLEMIPVVVLDYGKAFKLYSSTERPPKTTNTPKIISLNDTEDKKYMKKNTLTLAKKDQALMQPIADFILPHLIDQ
jgi:hypothetical protein